MGFLARRQHNKLNTQTRTALNELDFTRYDKIHGVVLPELRGVQEHHVEDWIREGRNFRGLCQIHDRSFCDVQGSIEAIRTLYNRVEYAPYKGQIPMEFLAKNLIELLEEHRC